MNILQTTPLSNIILAGRCCYDSISKATKKRDLELLDIWKINNHLSVFDHMWFKINIKPESVLNILWDFRINICHPMFRYIYIDKNSNLYINLRTIFELQKYNYDKRLPRIKYIIDICLEKLNKLKREYIGLKINNYFTDGIHILFKEKDFPFTTLYLNNCFSRDTLHQFIRHYSFRSVKSTRYTLNKKNLFVDDFILPDNIEIQNHIKNYIRKFEVLKKNIQNNDIIKSILIESLKTSGIFTFYNQDLKHMLKIRDFNNNKVYYKFRDLTKLINDVL